jgi:hypothetical protein
MVEALRPVCDTCARRIKVFFLFSIRRSHVKTKCIPLFCKSANLVKKFHSELRKINFVPTFLAHIMSNFMFVNSFAKNSQTI